MATFRNKFTGDLRIFGKCIKKIDKTRFYKLMKMVYDSIESDGLHPELVEQHDKMFEPRTEYERDLWNMFREFAKNDMNKLIKRIENGKTGGRPKKLTEEEKQKALDKAVKSVGAVGKNEVIITPDFELPKCDYFDSYRKTYTPAELKKVTEWLKKTKLNEKVDYMWIGKQIQNFKKRTTGKIF